MSKSDLEDTLAFQIGYPDRKLSPNARGKWALKETARKLAYYLQHQKKRKHTNS